MEFDKLFFFFFLLINFIEMQIWTDFFKTKFSIFALLSFSDLYQYFLLLFRGFWGDFLMEFSFLENSVYFFVIFGNFSKSFQNLKFLWKSFLESFLWNFLGSFFLIFKKKNRISELYWVFPGKCLGSFSKELSELF